MCADLGIRSVALLTNNPNKVQQMRTEGVPVARRVAVAIEPNEHNRGYLVAKTRRMGHHLDLSTLTRGTAEPLAPDPVVEPLAGGAVEYASRPLMARQR
jgi:hypothetical protein